MGDLELLSPSLQCCSYRLTRARGIHLCVEELLDAAIMMRYDFWIYDSGMTTNNIPSTIYFSFDIVSSTAPTAFLVENNIQKNN